MLSRRTWWVVLLSVFSSILGYAQTTTAILREGDEIPGVSGEFVETLGRMSITSQGGYAVQLDAVSDLDVVWGNANGGAGSPLRMAGTIGSYQQINIVSFEMSDAGDVCYNGTVEDLNSPGTFHAAMYLEDTLLGISGGNAPLAGRFWWSQEVAWMTRGGIPYWRALTTDTVGGSADLGGIFIGTTPGVFLLGGSVMPNIPFPLQSLYPNSAVHRPRISSQGSHSILHVQWSALDDQEAIAVDGTGVLLDGILFAEGETIPTSLGANPGETWLKVGWVDINESGSWVATGTVSPNLDGIIMRDGAIDLRRGDLIDGEVFRAGIVRPRINDSGDVIVLGDVLQGGVDRRTIFVNDEVILTNADKVDLDGDSIPEVTSTLRNFSTLALAHISERTPQGTVHIYFVADVDTLGTTDTSDDTETLMHMEIPVAGLRMLTRPALVRANKDVKIKMRGGVPGNPVGLFVTGVDGFPVYSLVTVLFFDGNGRLDLPGTNPSGLGTLDIDLQGVTIDAGGNLDTTNTATLFLRP
jgi:hypothetical protein